MLQSAHAAVDFQHQHPEIAKKWNSQSNYLIILSVENEEQLLKYLEKIKYRGIKHTAFREPDIGDQLTAIGIEPGENSKKLTSRLPLALREVKV
jgi:peptidyl-tRNA hydrolase